jgi:hypothetical protein
MEFVRFSLVGLTVSAAATDGEGKVNVLKSGCYGKVGFILKRFRVTSRLVLGKVYSGT